MAKITVKRFLNKKIKPIEVYSDLLDLGYPLYYSITYNRKTQYVKSICGAVMTQKAFDFLQENSEPLNYETNYLNFNFTIKLSSELDYIAKAVHFIVNENKQENIFDEDFIPKLKSYFERLDISLFNIGWLKYDWIIEPKNILEKGKAYTPKEILSLKIEKTEDQERIDNLYLNRKDKFFEIEQLYFSFNKEKNLIKNIQTIENILNINLEQYFYSDTIKFWYVIDLIVLYHNKISENYMSIKIDFIINDDLEVYTKFNEKHNYPVSNLEIIKICKVLKNHALIF